MDRRELLGVALIGSAVSWVGCEQKKEYSKKEAPEESKPEPAVTGKAAINRMFPTARLWSRDIQLLKLNSILLPEYAHADGKVGGWQAVFAAPSMAKARTYRWSNQDIGNKIKEGVYSGVVDDWAGPSPSSTPFSLQNLVKDTDEIWRIVAEKKAKFIADNPKLPVVYEVAVVSGVPGLCWQVLFGESLMKTKLRVIVDAVNGRVVKDK
jgi:hypothetical protein